MDETRRGFLKAAATAVGAAATSDAVQAQGPDEVPRVTSSDSSDFTRKVRSEGTAAKAGEC